MAERARAVLDDGFQTELPFEERMRAEREWRRMLREAPAEYRRRRRDDGTMVAPSGFASVLMWALTIVVAVVIALFLVRELGGYVGDPQARGDPDEEGGAGRPDRGVVERPLADAEELARASRYGEAIHTLLLRTLDELARKLPLPLPRSLTSREILDRVDLEPSARAALAQLVLAVELTHFGGGVPGENDYRECLEQFRRFAAVYTGVA